MKKILIAVLLVTILLLPAVSARKGVGIMWSTQAELVDEGDSHCVQYGVYNPWDEDVNAKLEPSDDFSEILEKTESEATFIAAQTMHENAISLELCFSVPKVYEEECVLGNWLCEQKCEEPEKAYEGDIIVAEEKDDSSGVSATALGVSVPLRLIVKCNAHPVDWVPVYILIIIIIILLIALIIFLNYRRPAELRKQDKVKRLQEQIKKLKK